MNARVALIGLLAIATLLPSTTWYKPRVPPVPTHVIGDRRVAACQRPAAGWNPANSNPSLRAWARCMNLRRQP